MSDVKTISKPLIRTQLHDRVATIAFDNYAKRNALNHELIGQVLKALEDFKSLGVRAVVLRSATREKVWSAGHDIQELPQADRDPLPYNDPQEQLLRAIKAYPAPVIAMVSGSVWGAACDLIMSCDLVFGDETCAFAITPAKLGLPYNVAGFLNFMARLPLAIVKEMFFTAEPIDAGRAQRVGIINAMVSADQLEAHTYGVAATIAKRSPASISAAKEAMHVLSEAVAVNPSTYEYIHGLRRDVYFGPDYHEGITAFLEKRAPVY